MQHDETLEQWTFKSVPPMKNQCCTKCAPGKRLPLDDIKKDHARLNAHLSSNYFDFFPLPLLVLNSQRQIVFNNKAFTNIIGVDDIEAFLAKRPGEAMGCVYAKNGDNGCGTSEQCRECGALRAILETMHNKENAMYDCQLLLKNDEGVTSALDVRVFTSPWETDEGTYVVVTFLDIGHEKRRQVLERIFFHDILNSAGGTRSLVDILLDEVPEHSKEIVNLVRSSLFALVDEIQKQKQLLAVEKNEYTVLNITLQGLEIVQSIINEYSAHPKAMERYLRIDEKSINVTVYSDFTLLRRILVNMLMNALEATPAGGMVTLGLSREGDKAVFWVKNSTVMSESVKLQVFKRSFSTKGQDRGLGTYSMKLLTENYLGGEVGFKSEPPDGTTFRLTLKSHQASL